MVVLSAGVAAGLDVVVVVVVVGTKRTEFTFREDFLRPGKKERKKSLLLICNVSFFFFSLQKINRSRRPRNCLIIIFLDRANRKINRKQNHLSSIIQLIFESVGWLVGCLPLEKKNQPAFRAAKRRLERESKRKGRKSFAPINYSRENTNEKEKKRQQISIKTKSPLLLFLPPPFSRHFFVSRPKSVESSDFFSFFDFFDR